MWIRRSEPELTDAEILENAIIEELILKLNQPERWLIIKYCTYEFCSNLILEWKGGEERNIKSPVQLTVPKRWHSIIQEKIDAIENFHEASKNEFLLLYLRGEYSIQIKLPGKKNQKTLDWLLNNIKEDPYYYQEDKNIVWFKTKKIATFCKTSLG